MAARLARAVYNIGFPCGMPQGPVADGGLIPDRVRGQYDPRAVFGRCATVSLSLAAT